MISYVCEQNSHFAIIFTFKGNNYYIGRRIGNVDKKLINIKPPSDFISRTPCSLTQRKIWKANELRCWLLYYGVSCLTGTLHPQFVEHFGLLSNSIYTLLKTKITSDEINEASDKLKTFVEQYEM